MKLKVVMILDLLANLEIGFVSLCDTLMPIAACVVHRCEQKCK